TVLLEFIQHQPQLAPDARRPFFAAVKSITSDYEKRRVLTSLPAKINDREALQSVFESVATMQSDYDRAETLLAFAKVPMPDESTRQDFLHAARAIGSEYEQNRVLAALAR